MASKTITGTIGGGNTTAPGNMMDELNKVIPGFSNLTSTASGNIGELLNGLPSPSLARNAGAYFGANSGMPGSEFVRNRGFDLYNTQSNQMKQQGLGDLLGLLGGVSGRAVATPGESLQDKQAGNQLGLGYANLSQQGSQFDRSFDFDKWLKSSQLGLEGVRTGNDMLSTYLSFLK